LGKHLLIIQNQRAKYRDHRSEYFACVKMEKTFKNASFLDSSGANCKKKIKRHWDLKEELGYDYGLEPYGELNH
jgi:hypothetical protein